MNLKRTALTGLAAAGLMASMAAPGVIAQTTENTSNNNALADVQVVTNGTFDVYFAPGTVINLGSTTLNSQNPEDTAVGQLQINYTDTLQSRSAFTVTLGASDFVRVQGGTSTIPATGFAVTHTGNVAQYQWDGHNINDGHTADHPTVAGPLVPPVPGNIGDIGYLVDNAQPSGGQHANTGDWSGAMNLSGTGSQVQFGYPGIGTVWSNGLVDVEVEIPNGTESGTYRSTLTLSVSFTAP